MYQSQFGMDRRPFSSTPDPTCIVPVGGMPEAISELEHCAQDGQGIGILTAPAGLGKTVLCRKLAEDLRDLFAVVFLPNANFPTRRSLLQAVLYEMGHPYLRLGEQELRLEFIAAVRDLCSDREGLVIIVDEAHLLHNRLLEELRTATHLVHNGELLVRLILSGQLELEERLIKKDLAAINQRIVCHSTLSSLSMLESQEYLEQRVDWAGGSLSNLMDPEAVRMICQASDGSPRCLNQLADHSLLLASACGDARVTTGHVLEALEELKQLPLQWNHIATPRPADGSHSDVVEIVCSSPGAKNTAEEEPPAACFEWGASEEETSIDEAAPQTEATLEMVELDEEITEEVDWLIESLSEDSEAEDEIELSWDAELAATLPESDEESAMETSSTDDYADEEIGIPALDPSEGDDYWAALDGIVFEEEQVEDHYAMLDQGIVPDAIVRESRDWHTWDPVEELRADEDAFDVPPVSESSEPAEIHDLPPEGEEWQPEDLKLPRHQPMSSDPTELIDRVLPLIEAALSDDCPDIEAMPAEAAVGSEIDSILANIAEIVGSGSIDDLEPEMVLIDCLAPFAPGFAKSNEYVLKARPEDLSADLEGQIAQTVLDTHTDLQPLMWASTTESEPDAGLEPPPRVAGEEPIRDPGDAGAFEELRDNLQNALEAAEPISEDDLTNAPAVQPQQSAIEYDIVMPEPDEEPTTLGPVTRTDSPSDTEIESHNSRKSYNNLFSKLRQKKQA